VANVSQNHPPGRQRKVWCSLNHEGQNIRYVLAQIWTVDWCRLCTSGPGSHVSLGFAFRPLLFQHTQIACHLAPIAWPIAKLLDYVLGVHDAHTYKKAELKSFLQFHRTGEEPLRDDEISILNGVLELNTKNVEEIMTPMQVVISLSLSGEGRADQWRRMSSHLARIPSWTPKLSTPCKCFVLNPPICLLT
jgi:hypothetical protein